jgi:hypothetical protein
MASEGNVMHCNDDGERACYPRATRLSLLISLIIHIAAVFYALGLRLSTVNLHRIYEGAGGLRSVPVPGIFVVVEVIFVSGLFVVFLYGIAFNLYRGDDSQSGKIYAICAFIAALVVAARYLGRQEAGYSNSLKASALTATWFIMWGIIATIFSFRADRFSAI